MPSDLSTACIYALLLGAMVLCILSCRHTYGAHERLTRQLKDFVSRAEMIAFVKKRQEQRDDEDGDHHHHHHHRS